MDNLLLRSGMQAHGIERATVVSIHNDGTIDVLRQNGTSVRCDLLCTGGTSLALAPDDCVLIWCSDGTEHGIVLGRIGASTGLLPEAIPEPELPPDVLVLEATKTLTLRVGDGSITIREDGKILIKGKDLVSHAQRVNRIKGGSVSIN